MSATRVTARTLRQRCWPVFLSPVELAVRVYRGEIACYMTLRVWPRNPCRLVALLLVMLCASGVPAHRLQAQASPSCDAADRVRGIGFVGSPLYEATTLAAAISTQSPSFFARVLRIGALPCSDSLGLQLDALRLAVLHRQAGWLQATVAVRTTPSADGVKILFAITPGEPTLMDTITIVGLPATEGRRPLDAGLKALVGERFDRVRLDTTITAVVTRLRDLGYARAVRPVLVPRVDTAAARVRVDLSFEPGLLTTVNAIRIDVQGIGPTPPTIDTADVRKLTSLHAGTRYRASDVLNAQRDLYRADVFRLVIIDTIPSGVPSPAGDSLIDLRIAVAEAKTRNARVGVGWATLECLRTQARFVDRRFLGVGRRLELTARASRIGVGAPADFAPGLCSRALRRDTLFTVLNHYLGATVSATRLFGSPLSPLTTVYTERRSEPYAYVREIGVGVLSEVTRTFSRRTAGTAGVQYENGKTKIDPAEACSRFGQCRKEEYDQSLFGRGVGVISGSLTHDRTNNALDPARGYRVRGELRAGQTFSRIDSSVTFYRTSAEGANYFRVFGGVIATRLQMARAFAPRARLVDGSPLIPQQERLFAGGQSTVRGFQQNLLGPLVYVVSQVDSVINGGVPVVQVDSAATLDRVVPRGGTALLVANLEYRRGFRWLAEQLQFAAFVDVGNIWEGGAEPFKFGNLRATPGLGLRIVTALGPFRVDVGYQPYEPRAGRALYLSKGVNGVGGSILCATPGNTVSIDPQNPGSIFDCPATYRPASARGVLSRLAFHFGLGQAF